MNDRPKVQEVQAGAPHIINPSPMRARTYRAIWEKTCTLLHPLHPTPSEVAHV